MRRFNVAAWLRCEWWGPLPFDQEITAGSPAEAVQIAEERLEGDGAFVRSITAQELET